MNTDNIRVNTQSSIKIVLDKVIYFDPFKIEEELHDADIIFITHNHFDHLDKRSINKIKNDNTVIVAPKSIEFDISGIDCQKYLLEPNDEIMIDNIKINAIPAYNVNKQFHPRINNWLGYLVNYNDITYYVMGDTDNTKEAEEIKCDILFIPIGGYYTMNVKEASELIKIIKPKVVIPTHYGSIIGSKDDGKELTDILKNTDINVVEKLY